jgi:[protein-PII] uridylyltransferase
VSKKDILYQYDGSMRTLLEEGSAELRAAHSAGAGGWEIVQRRTALIDRLLRDAHAGLARSVPLPSLVAVGGYGRGELNPHSDVDILVLCRNEGDRQCAPGLLYRLWDAGMDVGYSVRTIAECLEQARGDLKTRTSLMESRLIAGDETLFNDYLGTMRSRVFYRNVPSFITSKLSERAAVRQRFGGSIYMREPNIKEGLGGLRDIHTALWVAFVKFRISNFDGLVSAGVITQDQFSIFIRSRDFLWRLRNEIHYASERKNDHFTFDLQERAAADFGYRDSTHLLAVERFMKTYFSHARNVAEFSSLVVNASLRKTVVRSSRTLRRLGPFSLFGRTLVAASEDDIESDPRLILAAFQAVQTRHAALSERLQEQIRTCRFDDRARSSPEAAALFLEILDRPGSLYDILSLMKDLRFLGRYVPEFRSIQALAKHDYYHRYTVDEHTLLALKALDRLWSGTFPSLAQLSSSFKEVPQRWVLSLAVLLHDLGKAYGRGHEHRGVELAGRILERLGIGPQESARIIFLIKNHLSMSTLSQRRELTDRKVISDFARRVGDRESLTLLYLLTYADISAVSPSAWSQWKAVLLQELYQRTLAVLEEKTEDRDEEEVKRRTELIRKEAGALHAPAVIQSFLAAMPLTYLLFTPRARVLDHIAMMERLKNEPLVIRHRHQPDRGYTELSVCAYDAYGLLSRTAGTLASKNLNILRAQAYTSKNGIMIDTFQVTGPDGSICTFEDVWESVSTELRDVLTGRSRPPLPGASRGTAFPGRTPLVSVDFDNTSSNEFTIIDVTARDRLGLLYRITRELYDMNLDITSAKIVTEGILAMDSFYVTDLLRKKVSDQDRLARIHDRLFAVLE